MVRKVLLLCGIVASLLYVAATIAPRLWEDYIYIAQRLQRAAGYRGGDESSHGSCA